MSEKKNNLLSKLITKGIQQRPVANDAIFSIFVFIHSVVGIMIIVIRVIEFAITNTITANTAYASNNEEVKKIG